MAQKKTASATSKTAVTRIKAVDDTPAKSTKTKSAKAAVVVEKPARVRKKPTAKGLARPFVAIGSYFTGAWYELKQVRWPTRKATWGLTLAVLLYTAFFIALVLLLDLAFQYLFDIILGK